MTDLVINPGPLETSPDSPHVVRVRLGDASRDSISAKMPRRAAEAFFETVCKAFMDLDSLTVEVLSMKPLMTTVRSYSNRPEGR